MFSNTIVCHIILHLVLRVTLDQRNVLVNGAGEHCPIEINHKRVLLAEQCLMDNEVVNM